MEFILTSENFLIREEELIKEDIISKSLEVLKRYNVVDITTDEYIKKPYMNSKIKITDFNIVLKINFNIISESRVINEELLQSLRKLDIEHISYISPEFRQGGIRTKTEEGFINRYSILIHLKNLTIDPSIFEESLELVKRKEYNILKRSRVLGFIKKYDIKDYNEFITVMTICTRDVNKFAKSGVDKDVKKMSYQIKDWTIKILFNEDYIDRVKRHDINGSSYYLLYTKIKHDKSLDGIISFHVPRNRAMKFDFANINEYELEKREYKIHDTEIGDKERMEMFIKIFHSNFVSSEFQNSLKEYFNGKYENLIN